MKYYIINSDGQEVSVDINAPKFAVKPGKVIAFNVTSEQIKQAQYYVKRVAGKNYISRDQVRWEKSPSFSNRKNIVHNHENYKVYRGFKPSGLSASNAGELITDMPGKVIKIFTAEGEKVSKGDTLLILEAMKMENEIKAGIDGTVKTINIQEGQALESGHLMIEIEEE